MNDRDYLYGHVCAHGSLTRTCEICDLEDEVCDLEDEVRRLRDGIAEHREWVLREVGGGEQAQTSADRRLWKLIGDNDA